MKLAGYILSATAAVFLSAANAAVPAERSALGQLPSAGSLREGVAVTRVPLVPDPSAATERSLVRDDKYVPSIAVNSYDDMPGTILIKLRDSSDQAANSAAEELIRAGFDADHWTLDLGGISYNVAFVLVSLAEEDVPAAAKVLLDYPFVKELLISQSAYNAMYTKGPVFRPSPVFTGEKGFLPQPTPVMAACHGETSCFMALERGGRGLCEAYKEDQSCFLVLNGVDRGWCEVIKESKSCFMAFQGADAERCERGDYPREHMFWAHCGNMSIPEGPLPNPLLEACRGERSCFMSLDGQERALCKAYKESRSCFLALDGADRAWCEVLNEGKSCFTAFQGADAERCERGLFPAPHLFWKQCQER